MSVSGVQRVRVTYEGPALRTGFPPGWNIPGFMVAGMNATVEDGWPGWSVSGVEAEGDALPDYADEREALRQKIFDLEDRLDAVEDRVSPASDACVAAPVPSPLLFKDGDVVAVYNSLGNRFMRMRCAGKWVCENGQDGLDDKFYASCLKNGQGHRVDLSRPVGEAE